MRISLLGLIDKIVLPIVLLVAVRYLGLFGVSFFFPDNIFNLSTKSDLFSMPFVNFPTLIETNISNSISWLFVALFISLFYGFVVFRTHFFHEDYIHPKQASHLYIRGWEFLVFKAKEAFHQNLGWIILCGAVFVLATVDFMTGTVLPIAYAALFAVVVTLVISSYPAFISEETT